MNCLRLIFCVLFLAFGTVRGWASAAATLTNHNLVYFQIDALPTAIPTNVIMLTGNLTNWQKLMTNVICNPCLIINPTDNYVPYRIDASTFGDSPWYRIETNEMGFNSTGRFILTNGNYSIYLGGGGNRTETGGGNIGIGSPSTLPHLTVGGYNFGLGSAAGHNITSGIQNIAIGFGALFDDTSGSWNTMVGGEAGDSVIGSFSTGIGFHALIAQTNSYNTAIGASSGGGATIGGNSIGNMTLSVFAGYGTGNGCTTGSNTVMVGSSTPNYAASVGRTNYNETVIVGASSGHGVTNLTQSVVIGTYAQTNVVTELTNVVVIGHNVSATNSNEIIIGNRSNTVAIFPITSYTGTGTNYLSDDGTFKPCCAPAGLTINPSDTYVPYRIDSTTFGDSWWYYLSTGMGIDTNIYFGPGVTNIFGRTNGTDLIYYAPAMLSQPAGINVKRGAANPVFFGATSAGGAMVSSPANRAILDVGAVSAFWDGTSFQPDSGAKNLGNTSGQGWHTVYTTNSYILAPYDDHDTNYVKTIETMVGPFTTFNLQSITNGVAGPVSGFEFRTNGVKLFRIPEAIWVDSMVPQTAVRVGATAPTTAAFNGGPATTLMFQNNRDDTVEFSVQLNHNYKQGTDISPHVHWCETAATGAGTNVVWELTYTWQNVNGVFGAYNTLYTTNYVTTTNWFHQLSEFPDISGSGKTVSSILVCQLRRLANSATADNYDQNVAFLGCDIHYQVDSPGSDSELSKSF